MHRYHLSFQPRKVFFPQSMPLFSSNSSENCLNWNQCKFLKEKNFNLIFCCIEAKTLKVGDLASPSLSGKKFAKLGTGQTFPPPWWRHAVGLTRDPHLGPAVLGDCEPPRPPRIGGRRPCLRLQKPRVRRAQDPGASACQGPAVSRELQVRPGGGRIKWMLWIIRMAGASIIIETFIHCWHNLYCIK